MNAPLTLLQRINAVQREVDYVQKEKKQGMRYSIVSHDAVTAKVRPLMVKHGVVYFPCDMDLQQVGNRTQATMTVRFVSVDDATDFMDVRTAGYGIDDQDKGPGKAISYAVKYALLKALGLESGDDPDQDQDVVHQPEPMPAPVERRSSASLKRDGAWQKLMLQLSVDFGDCHSLVTLSKLRADYRERARSEGWPRAWLEALANEFDQFEDGLQAQAEKEAAALDHGNSATILSGG